MKTKSTCPKAGDEYRVRRRTGPARHVRVVRVTNKTGHRPVVHYVEVTRSGKCKSAKKKRALRHHPRWTGEAWEMAPAFELVEGGLSA